MWIKRLIALLFWPFAALAEPEPVAFLPPETQLINICAVKGSSRDVEGFWAEWDATALPALSTQTLKGDITALHRADPVRWAPVSLRIIDLLAERDASFAKRGAVLARIQVLEAAGRFSDIKDLELVDGLAASDALSGYELWTLSRLYRNGIGTSIDVALADFYEVQSAKAGFADALLSLAARSADGDAPSGWDTTQTKAARQAFRSLSARIDAKSCERIKKIVRAYEQGEAVAQDYELAAKWRGFAAQLGDARAAFELYEMHALAEVLDQDPKVMLDALNKAAIAGLPRALIALGQVYEVGAFVKPDRARAIALYQQAAEAGARTGLIRLANVLKPSGEGGDTAQLYIETLRALVAHEDAPAFAFTRLAQASFGDEAWPPKSIEYRRLLERAAGLGDKEAMALLAEVYLMDPSDKDAFGRARDLLAELVSVHGSTGAAKTLYHALLCQAPDAPRLSEALYWQKAYHAADPPIEVAQDRLAAVQSQAVTKRASAVLRWEEHLLHNEMLTELRFWQSYLNIEGENVQPQKAATQQQEFERLLAGLTRTSDVDQAAQLNRAIGLMSCDYKSAMAVARAAVRIGAFDDVDRYINVAGHLHGDKPWALLDYGRSLLRIYGQRRADEAAAAFERAFSIGHKDAGEALFDVLSQKDGPLFDPDRAGELKEALGL